MIMIKKYIIVALALVLQSHAQFDTSMFNVDFDACIDKDSGPYKNKFNWGQNREHLQMFRELFNKNHPCKVIQSEQAKIPKIIHQIWVGPKPLPDLLKRFMKSWQKMHPDWKYYLWTDKEVNQLADFDNKDLYLETRDYREKSDILRMWLLHTFGGVYADCDFECLMPFDFLHHSYDFYIGMPFSTHNEMVVNGIVGCAPGHPIMRTAMDNVIKKQLRDWRDRSGVFYFSNQFCKSVKDAPGVNIAFPPTFFYPIASNVKKNESLYPYIKPETMAIHYWANSLGTDWRPKKAKPENETAK